MEIQDGVGGSIVMKYMGNVLIGLVALALVTGALGFSKSSGFRTASRVVSLVLFAIFGVGAVLGLYGSVALSNKGGGVLILAAIPCAFIAWMFFKSFSSSLANEPYFDLSVYGKIAHNQTLIDSQIRAHEETIAANSKKLDSFWVTPGKRRRLRDELAHSRFMKQRLSEMKETVANPEIYRGDES